MMFVLVSANDFDPFFLWDIGIEWADIECSKDRFVRKWDVFNETNKISCIFKVQLLFFGSRL